MKKLITILLSTFLLLSFTGCGSKNSEANPDASEIIQESEFVNLLTENADKRWNICTEADTVYAEQIGNYVFFLMYNKEELGSDDIEKALANSFENNIESTSKTNDIVEKMIEADTEELGLMAMPVSEGLLNGFNAEITGFEEATMFSPMIGSIPFIGYVFKLK